MTELTHKKIALVFALFSFGVMVFGSVFSGARITTAFVRGTEAAILFGLLAWGLGTMLVEKDDDFLTDVKFEDKGKEKDQDQTV
ncbi:MAG: hypothetical protein A3K09_05205 [Nitrospinae bacterium RIFCSPLOWO2_12_FULL_47_7]|nr:MAG: hypothetical protein A3K09_05205 [Nitrospinae bacterium RIFCSPLOWO2_12_FULL_47_7]